MKYLSNKIYTLILLLLMCFTLYAEEEVSFDDLEDDSPSLSDVVDKVSAKGLSFSLYSDVALNGFYREKTDDDLTNYIYKPDLSFGQNHFSLMGTLENEYFQVVFDASVEAEFFEFSMFRDWGTLTIGKIFLPFGSPDYHHIYGGYAGETGFVPFFWTDMGVKANFEITDWFSIDAGISNGFTVMNGVPILSGTTDKDTNIMKMLTLRLGFSPTLTTEGSFSFLLDSFNEDSPLDNFTLMYGTDWSHRAGSFTFRGGIAVTSLRIGEDGFDEKLFFPLTYYRLGWYTEISKKFSKFKSRIRFGGIDPDSRDFNEQDMLNANFAILIPMGPLEFQTIYLYNWAQGKPETLEPGIFTGNYHEILFKLLIRL